MQYVARGAPGTTVYDHLSTASRSSGTTVTTTCCKKPNDITYEPSGLPLAAARVRLQPMHVCVGVNFVSRLKGPILFFDGTQNH